VKEAGHTILTPLVSLDTPGKATVEVVILADPVSPWLPTYLFMTLPDKRPAFSLKLSPLTSTISPPPTPPKIVCNNFSP